MAASDIPALLGSEKTPDQWIATAEKWIADLGDALDEASPS